MNLSNTAIFILGTTKFDNIYESTSYRTAKYLAKHNEVYYIENPYTWKDYFNLIRTEKFSCRKKLFSPGSDGLLFTEIPNLRIVITPPLLSINFLPENFLYRLFLRINEWIITKRIKKIIRIKSIDKYIFINSFNFHYPNIADELKALLKVYHCVDPLVLPFDRKHGLISEMRLIKKSDLVICTSKELYNRKKKLHRNTFFIPNAADIDFCSKALDEQLPVHESIASLKKPVIGYFGNIERRLDFNLIKEIADKNPDKSFVFAGPLALEFIPKWFLHTPNIYTPGRIDYEQLPAVLKGFDIALIPFKKDEVSATIFPLKLFEYLGAGKPVICTDFNPDLEEFTKGTVRFAKNINEFNDAIREELRGNTPEKIKARLDVAKENIWEKRVNEFSQLMCNELMELKSHTS